MLETPEYPAVPVPIVQVTIRQAGGLVATPDNQQERLDPRVQNPQRPYARHEQGPLPMKRWSDPHGDMGSQAERETTWPPVLDEDRR